MLTFKIGLVYASFCAILQLVWLQSIQKATTLNLYHGGVYYVLCVRRVKSSSEGSVYTGNFHCMMFVFKSLILQPAVRLWHWVCVGILLFMGLGQSAWFFLILDEWPRRWCSFEENWQTLQLHVLNSTPASCRDIPCSAPGMWWRNNEVCFCELPENPNKLVTK